MTESRYLTSGGGYEAAPSLEQLSNYARRHALNVSADELGVMRGQVENVLFDLIGLDNLSSRMKLPSFVSNHAQREPGRLPRNEEDPYNSIIRFCDIRGVKDGKLSGMRIGVKDKIAVAGVPMTSGENWEAPPIPREDAVAVERLLEAGVRIIGKTNLGQSPSGARNPHSPQHSPGFSSSGCGAAVSSGIVDASLGGDAGGSVRIPAAWCGVVGMKATHGLIPSFPGACRKSQIGFEGFSTDDCVELGPITRSVMDNARMLEVLAGQDGGLENVQHNYTAVAQRGVEDLRIGIVSEALEPAGCTPEILGLFERAKEHLSAQGARLIAVSVPQWSTFSATFQMGVYLSDQSEALGGSLKVLAKAHLRELGLIGDGESPGRAAYMALWELRKQIDAVLGQVDLFITPTTVREPCELRSLEVDTWREVRIASKNTAPLNLTGHPALSVPMGKTENGLPTGLQIIGRRFAERTVYRAGFAFEDAIA